MPLGNLIFGQKDYLLTKGVARAIEEINEYRSRNDQEPIEPEENSNLELVEEKDGISIYRPTNEVEDLPEVENGEKLPKLFEEAETALVPSSTYNNILAGGENQMTITEEQQEYLVSQGSDYLEDNPEVVDQLELEEDSAAEVVGLALELENHEVLNGPQVGREDLLEYALQQGYEREFVEAKGAIAGDNEITETYDGIISTMEGAAGERDDLAVRLLERDAQSRQQSELLTEYAEGLHRTAVAAGQIETDRYDDLLDATEEVADRADEAYAQATNAAESAHEALFGDEDLEEETEE